MTIHTIHISIHALLAESDANRAELNIRQIHFYPRSPCGERQFSYFLHIHRLLFLSTLSLRRATSNQPVTMHTWRISIHALLAESDDTSSTQCKLKLSFLSTLSLRRATRRFRTVNNAKIDISIHALLAESDAPNSGRIRDTVISIHALLAESDYQQTAYFFYVKISIHALLAESDVTPHKKKNDRKGFLSTLSLRRATGQTGQGVAGSGISIHALLAESDAFSWWLYNQD